MKKTDKALKASVFAMLVVSAAAMIKKRYFKGERACFAAKKKDIAECPQISGEKEVRSASFYERYMKRPLDMICAAMALLFLSPVLGITALLVRIKLGSPVLFTQERPGLNGKIFKLYKFRTMTAQRDENGSLLPDEMRLTNFGKKLRSTSLDELPELFNILKGDMSIIGPRPLLSEYLPLYNEKQRHRHDVRPGLTGLAQVKGRNALSWEEKFHWDTEYAKNISFRMDLKILFLTVWIVLKRKGIQAEGSVTMEAFHGTE